VIAVAVAFFGLLAVLTSGLRAVTLSGAYGVVPAEMPVVPAAIDDPGFYTYKEEPQNSLGPTTPAVVLTTDAFYFGDLQAFTSDFAKVRDKYVIRHIDGTPQLTTLVQTMDLWVTDRARHENIPINKALVFIPAGDIPMPIVVEVIAGLRKSPHFQRIIVGSGLL